MEVKRKNVKLFKRVRGLDTADKQPRGRDRSIGEKKPQVLGDTKVLKKASP